MKSNKRLTLSKFIFLVSICLFAFTLGFSLLNFNTNSSTPLQSTSQISSEYQSTSEHQAISTNLQTTSTEPPLAESTSLTPKPQSEVGGIITITAGVNYGIGGTAIVEANDKSLIGGGWKTIMSGTSGVVSGWLATDGSVDFRVSYSADRNYKFDHISYTNGSSTSSTTSSSFTASAYNDRIKIVIHFVSDVKTFSISYDLDGGINNPSNPTEYYSTHTGFTIREATKTGYIFDGWTGMGITSPSKTIYIAQGSNTNLSYKANWTAILYTLTFNKNGGSGGTNEVTNIKYGDRVSFSSPQLTGHRFTGYTIGSSSIYSGFTWNYTDNQTAKANWTPETYYITLNKDGGTGGSDSAQIVYNSYLNSTSVVAPIKHGYNFLGYYYGSTQWFNASGYGSSSIQYTFTYGVEVTAKWEVKTVAVDISCGTGINKFALQYLHNANTEYTSKNIPQIEGLSILTLNVSNSMIATGFAWNKYVITTYTGGTAIRGINYDFVDSNGDILGDQCEESLVRIKLYDSIKIQATSCIQITLISISNGVSNYSEDGYGGAVGINSTNLTRKTETLKVEIGSNVDLYAMTLNNCSVFGFYEDYDNNGGKGYALSSSIVGSNYKSTIIGVNTSTTIYAVYTFVKYELKALSYSSNTNDYSTADDNTIGNSVQVSDGSLNYFSTAKIGNGLAIQIVATPSFEYFFIGWYSNLTTLQTDVNNNMANNPEIFTPSDGCYLYLMPAVDTTIYAKFAKKIKVEVKSSSTSSEIIQSVTIIDDEANSDYKSIEIASDNKSLVAYYTYNTNIISITATFDDVHYTFTEWTWSKGGTSQTSIKSAIITQTASDPATLIYVTDELIFIANATPNKYGLQVTELYADNEDVHINITNHQLKCYDPNDDISEASFVAYIDYQSTRATLFAPEKDGYTFIGWYRHDDSLLALKASDLLVANKYSANQEVTSIDKMSGEGTPKRDINLIYYAFYIKNYELTLKINSKINLTFDGTIETDGDYKIYKKSYHYLQNFEDITSFQFPAGYSYRVWTVKTDDGYIAPIGTIEALSPNISNLKMNAGNSYLTMEVNIQQKSVEAAVVFAEYDSVLKTDKFTYCDADHLTGASGEVSIENQTKAGYVTYNADLGEQVVLSATPKAGYAFYAWMRCNDTIGRTLVFNNSPNVYSQLGGFVGSTILTKNTNYTTEPISYDQMVLYYAVFIKSYTITLKGVEGLSYTIGSTQPFTTSADGSVTITSLYRHQVSWSNSLESGCSISKWEIINQDGEDISETSIYSDFLKSSDLVILNRIYPIANVILKPVLVRNAPNLTVYRALQNANDDGYTIEEEPCYNDGMSTGVDLVSLAKSQFILDGFDYVWMYTDRTLLNPIGTYNDKLFMPNYDYTLYVKQDRKIYNITTDYLTTSVSDNITVTNNKEGGQFTASTTAKFGGGVSLIAVANDGYYLRGIYSNINCTDDALLISPSGFQTTYPYSFVMGEGDVSIYALFARISYSITIAKNPNIDDVRVSLSVGDTLMAYFGQEVSVSVSLGEKFQTYYDLVVYKSSDSTKTDIKNSSTSFIQTNSNVVVSLTAYFKAFEITYNANGGSFVNTSDMTAYILPNGKVLGRVSFNENDYTYFTNVEKTNTKSGVPTPIKSGFNFVGYYYIDNNSNKHIITSGANYNPWVYDSNAEFFAEYSIGSLKVSIEKCSLTNLVYNGTFQNALKVNILNKSSELSYSYTWYKLGAMSPLSCTSDTLQLRSVSQSGTYYCVVDALGAEGNSVIQQTLNLNITIDKKEFNITLDNATYMGDKLVNLSSSNVSNLVSLHSFKSGSILFKAGVASDKIYTNANISECVTTYEIQTFDADGITLITSQDGDALKNNYTFKFNGTITIKAVGSSLTVKAGVYERTINSSFADVFSGSPLSGISTTFTYSKGFDVTENSYLGGLVINYVTSTNLDGTINISLSNIPTLYEYFSIKINGESQVVNYLSNSLSFTLTEAMVSENNIDIRIYFTKQCLVTLNYNIFGGEILTTDLFKSLTQNVIATNGSELTGINNFTRTDFTFAGWYYDVSLKNAVVNPFTKTGTANIYAKWTLNPITTATISTTSISHAYNGIIDNVNVQFNNLISYRVDWYKKSGEEWNIYLPSSSEILFKNVIDSGLYSAKITATYNGQTQILDVNTLNVNVNITEKTLDLSTLNLDKTYDATTNLIAENMIFATGIGTESVKLNGRYSSKDVAYDALGFLGGNVIAVPLESDFYLTSASENTLAKNYAISNTSLSGKINPYNIRHVFALTKIFDGEVYRENIFINTLFGDIIIANVLTISANAGTYNYLKTSLLTPETLSITDCTAYANTCQNAGGLPGNYSVDFSGSSITIQKADLNFDFDSLGTYYDGNEHYIAVYDKSGNEITSASENIESITYTLNGANFTSHIVKIDAGVYNISVLVAGDRNHNNFAKSATLTISKVDFSVTFKYLSDEILTKKDITYTGSDIQNNFTVVANNLVKTSIVPTLTKIFTPYTLGQIVEIGNYILSVSYDDTNFTLKGLPQVEFEIVKIQILDPSLFTFANSTLVYNSLDRKTEFVNTATFPSATLIDAIVINVEQNGVLATTSIAKDVGIYTFTIYFKLVDDVHYTLGVTSKSASLEITPFTITSANSSYNISKTYDGKNTLLASLMTITLSAGITENLKISGEYSSVSASENILINNFTLKDNSGTKSSNYNITAGFAIYGDITKKQVSIFYNITESLRNISSANPFDLTVTKTNSSKFVTGLVDSDYAEFTVKTYNTISILETVTELTFNYAESGESYSNLSGEVVFKNSAGIVSSNYTYVVSPSSKIVLNKITYTYILTLTNDTFEYSGDSVELNFILNKDSDVPYSASLSGGSYKMHNTSSSPIIDNIMTITDSLDNPITSIKSANKHIIKIFLTNTLDKFQNGENYITFVITITKAVYTVDLGNKDLIYGETSYTNTYDFIGKNSEQFMLDFTTKTSTLSQNVGVYEVNNSNLNITERDSLNLMQNYELTFAGTYTIKPKIVSPSATYSLLNLIYNGTNQISAVENVIVSFGSVSLSLGADYNRTILMGERATNVVKDAGSYSVVLTSTNYNFNSEGVVSITYDFNVSKKQINVVFSNLNGKVYNNNYQTINYEFKDYLNNSLDGICLNDLLGQTLTYSTATESGLINIKNAGTYTAHITINNDNYELMDDDFSAQFEISPYTFLIDSPLASEVWFNKYYGADDPSLTKTFVSEFGENLIVKFTREAGESVKRYKLITSEIDINNSTLIKSNYTLGAFTDDNGLFAINALIGTNGILKVVQISDIEETYDGSSYSGFNYNSYKASFEVRDYLNNLIDEVNYDLSLTLKFTSSSVTNVGNYVLQIDSATSSTHSTGVMFVDNNKFFKITAKTLTINYGGSIISKQYNQRTNIPYSPISLLESEVVMGDTVNLSSEFANSNVGSHNIVLKLTGASATNYTFTNPNLTGTITPKQVTIVSKTDATAFDKTYDKTNIVDTSKLQVVGVYYDEEYVLSGTYNNQNVGSDKPITFAIDNTNYELTGTYSGNISPKELGLTPASITTKQFDGNTSISLLNLFLDGVITGDNVGILSAEFDSSEVGARQISITLNGTSKNNYFIDLIDGSITNRNITLVFYYGDDEEYTVNFKTDGQNILSKVASLTQFYGTALSDASNSVNTLPAPSRIGYSFNGWYSDSALSTNYDNSIIIDQDIALLAPNYEVKLYASWVISTYNLEIQIMTEEVASNAYAFSNIGGKYTVNDAEKLDQKVTLEVEYYSSQVIIPSAFAGFTLNSVLINGIDKLSAGSATIDNITSDTTATIKFNRQIFTLTILDSAVTFPSDFPNGQKSVKYEGSITLPTLSLTGYVFKGYNEDQFNKTPQYFAETDIQIFNNITLYTIFGYKEFIVKIETNGGEDSTFEYFDAVNKTIKIEYGSNILGLPSLVKNGYEFSHFELYSKTNLLNNDIKVGDEFVYDYENLTIYALYSGVANDFTLVKQLDLVYTDNNDSNMAVFYKIDSSESLAYTSTFTALTGTKVTFTYTLLKDYYSFEAWIIGDNVLTTGKQIIDDVTYYVYGNSLEITNFIWESAEPIITAKYLPNTYEIVLDDYDTSCGNITLNNVFEENSKTYAYAGSIVTVECQVFAGYKIDSYTITGCEYVSNGNTFTLTGIDEDIVISIVLKKQTYKFNIVTNGEALGYEKIEYSINDAEYLEYLGATDISTGDILLIRITVKTGYVLSLERNAVGGGEVSVENQNDPQINPQITKYSLFVSEFTINLMMNKVVYTVSAVKLISDGESYTPTLENTITIQNNGGENISSAKYLDRVTFNVASIKSENVAINGNSYNIEKYEFLGWFYNFNDIKYLPYTESLNYEISVENNLIVYAIFKVKTFEISFATSDINKGSVSTDTLVTSFGDGLTENVLASAVSGYEFVNWTYYYQFENGTKTPNLTLVNSEIDKADFSKIYTRIFFTATFANYSIDNINLNAKFDDGSEAGNKISVKYAEITQQNINISGIRTRETLLVYAIASEGYKFTNWQVEYFDSTWHIAEAKHFLIVNNTYNKNIYTQTLSIQFIGSVDISEYKITAIFEKNTNNILVQMKLDNGLNLGGGIIEDDLKVSTGVSMMFSVKTESSFDCYIYIYKGYSYDYDTAIVKSNYTSFNQFTVTKSNCDLTSDESVLYAGKIKLSVSGYKTDETIVFNSERTTTTLYFKKLVDFATKEYEDSFTATIKFGTNVILIDDFSKLMPTFENMSFTGWTESPSSSKIVINKQGNLTLSSWNKLIPEGEKYELYPLFETKKIQIVLTLKPNTANKNSNYYAEMLNNLGTSTPIKIGDNYFFYLGASFGLSLPALHDDYDFIGYEYYIVKNGQIELVELNSETANLSSKSLIELGEESEFIYTEASNYNAETYAGLANDVLNINVIFGINYYIEEKNFFDDNEGGVVGGQVNVTDSVSQTYSKLGDELHLSAIADRGYDFVEWEIIVNGLVTTNKNAELNHILTAPTTFRAIFKGKQVKLTFGVSEYGQGSDLSGLHLTKTAGNYFAFVGDIINISATANVGYKLAGFSNSNFSELIAKKYQLKAEDGLATLTTITPIFEVKNVNVEFVLLSQIGTISANGKLLESVKKPDGSYVFSMTIKYFDNIDVKVIPVKKYQFKSATLKLDGNSANNNLITIGATSIKLFSSNYDNASTITFNLQFNKLYWYEYVIENNLIDTSTSFYPTVKTDLDGTGFKNDPYKIRTKQDLALWAYIINERIMQTSSNKNVYNDHNTYYEITYELTMEDRYWTPIGTKENPLKATVFMYRQVLSISVDESDLRYNYITMFDPEVLTEYGGLFGYLDGADIQIKSQSYATVYVIIGIVGGLLIILLVILIIVSHKRNKQLKNFDSKNNPFL